jgi:hypothetical protein
MGRNLIPSRYLQHNRDGWIFQFLDADNMLGWQLSITKNLSIAVFLQHPCTTRIKNSLSTHLIDGCNDPSTKETTLEPKQNFPSHHSSCRESIL